MSAQPDNIAALWYVHYRGQKLGPYHWEQVAQYFADCGSPTDFLVWTKGQAQWLPIQSVSAPQVEKNVETPAPASAPTQPQASGGLSIGLKDRVVVADPNAKSGLRSTSRVGTQEVKPLSVAIEISKIAGENIPAQQATPTPAAKPAEPSREDTLSGWINSPADSGPQQVDTPETEPEKPLDLEFRYRVPEVKAKPPLYVTILLAIACGATYFQHVPGFQMPKTTSPFMLRCHYQVETMGTSSIRQPIKVAVSGDKFRTSTPQILKDFALFQDGKLIVYDIPTKKGKTPKAKIYDRPNPKLLGDIMLWVPRVRGEPVGMARVAKRSARQFSETTELGRQTKRVQEWIDAEQGIVLKRLETTAEGTKIIEKKHFECSRVTMGPVPRGSFKEPT